jgi:hypothetical protein
MSRITSILFPKFPINKLVNMIAQVFIFIPSRVINYNIELGEQIILSEESYNATNEIR